MAIVDFIKGLFEKEEGLAQKSLQKLMTLSSPQKGASGAIVAWQLQQFTPGLLAAGAGPGGSVRW